jgi:aryl-alcohol dehydrogenase-like predicted oxidoreductase
LGSDNFGNPYGCDEETSHRIMAKAFDAGINFLDTSDSYSIGDSERVIGSYFRASGKRDQIVLATKYRSQVGEGVNDIGASRYHIVRTVEASLKRLKTDRIDLLYCHSWDVETPIEETLRAVDDLIHQGKVLYAGASNFPTWVLTSALWISDVRNLYRIEAMQSVFNILQPGLAIEMLPMASKHGVAVVPYSPLASGMLTGKHLGSYVKESKFGERDDSRGGVLKHRYGDDLRQETVAKLVSVAEKHEEPVIRLALQWVVEHNGVTAPIFGARRIDQLDGILDAWSRPASADAMAEVREIADEFAASATMNYPPASGQAGVTTPKAV